MGDRFVVGFQDKPENSIVYLYSHWGGEAQEKILANALDKAQGRWNDPDYGTRIVVSQIVGDSWNDTLGFGLSVNNFAMPDYDTIQVVEWHSQSVSMRVTSMPNVVVSSVPLEHFCLERVV